MLITNKLAPVYVSETEHINFSSSGMLIAFLHVLSVKLLGFGNRDKIGQARACTITTVVLLQPDLKRTQGIQWQRAQVMKMVKNLWM